MTRLVFFETRCIWSVLITLVIVLRKLKPGLGSWLMHAIPNLGNVASHWPTPLLDECQR